MSGTSGDGVDAALCEFDDQGTISILDTVFRPYEPALREQIHTLCNNVAPSDQELVAVDGKLVAHFEEAVSDLLKNNSMSPADIQAIGSHGQTVRHCPECNPPYSLQIGNAQALADKTGIVTIGDLRTADLSAGGQGAPLAPGFHNAIFRSDHVNRAILNIGGIANLTYLPRDDSRAVTGFDTGPGNTLIDSWTRKTLGQAFDRDGKWAQSGTVIPGLLARLLEEPYFAVRPPKSTGRELFSDAWLDKHLESFLDQKPEDIAATLVALSVSTIADAINRFAADAEEVFVCGGGAHNAHLLGLLENELGKRRLATTAELGIDPDWVEAAAFAWLARQTLLGLPGNLPEVTGASRPVVLGTLHAAAG